MDLQKLSLSEAAFLSGPVYGSYPSSLFLQSLTSPLMYRMLSTIPYPCPPAPYPYRSCYPYPVGSGSPPVATSSPTAYGTHLLSTGATSGSASTPTSVCRSRSPDLAADVATATPLFSGVFRPVAVMTARQAPPPLSATPPNDESSDLSENERHSISTTKEAALAADAPAPPSFARSHSRAVR